jgi:hypothetical protein
MDYLFLEVVRINFSILRSKFNIVFPVGLYFVTEKPMDSNDFLKDFVNEATHLVSNGIMIKNYTYKVVIDVFVVVILLQRHSY